MKRIGLSVLSILIIFSILVGCADVQTEPTASLPDSLEIINYDGGKLEVGDVFLLVTNAPDAVSDQLQWSSSSDAVYVDSVGRITAMKQGEAIITVKLETLSTRVKVTVLNQSAETTPSTQPDVKPAPGPDTEPGPDPVPKPDTTPAPDTEPSPDTEPETKPVPDTLPISPERDKFYGTADPADSYQEALERSSRGELSGATTVPDQAPIRLSYQPKQGSMLIRNSQPYYADTNTYVVVDAYGREVFRIYRGGGYITLEEVAAYVYAFGDVPANYVSNKKTSPSSSIWGEYLRLNHSAFSGSTSKYPYEPMLPRISGCGGDLYYYEIDIGTTGTDCDPGYDIRTYNDGYTITRGAARIVYTRYDQNRNNIIDPNEKFVFYTYNHYNDFQEYLNYYGGWGVMFGNITGGGTLSSKYDYNPTPYVPSVPAPLPKQARSVTVLIWLPAIDDLYGKRRVA